MADEVWRGYLVKSHWIDVRDESGEKILTVKFGDAVDIQTRPLRRKALEGLLRGVNGAALLSRG